MSSVLKKIDPGTLSWVKVEIDDTLSQATDDLNLYLRDPADTTPLRQLTHLLHQVTGTLQMVELDGAALLAQEIEVTVDKLLQQRIEGSADTIGIVKECINELVRHLERLSNGALDSPIKLVPAINNLRVLDGSLAVTALEFFEPDLGVSVPARTDASHISDQQVYRQLRRQFQTALLQSFKSTEVNVLPTLLSVVEKLYLGSRFEAVARLWWISCGFIEALINNQSSADIEQKKLLGQLDQRLRQLTESGESSLVEDAADNLLYRMLYDIGITAWKGRYVKQIKTAFELDLLLHGDSATGAEDGQPPPLQQLKQLGLQLTDELDRARNMMTAFFEPGEVKEEVLESLKMTLADIEQQVGDAGMLALARLIAAISQALSIIDANGTRHLEHISLQLAGALLFFENSVLAAYEPDSEWQLQVESTTRALESLAPELSSEVPLADATDVSKASLTGPEFRQLLAVVASEINTNLVDVEQALEAFSQNPKDFEVLETVPRSLTQIQGALQTLGQVRVAELVNLVTRCVSDVYNNEIQLQSSMMEALAVGITSVQAYVEGLEQDSEQLSELIDSALGELEQALGELRLQQIDIRQLLDRIDRDLETWLADNADQQAFLNLRQSLRDIVTINTGERNIRTREIASEINDLLEIVSEDSTFLSDEVTEMLRRSVQMLRELNTGADESETLSEETADQSGQEDRFIKPDSEPEPYLDVDEAVQAEVLGIFLEEAGEILPAIDSSLQRWHDDELDHRRVTDLRRYFHTLKGSGRLAGVKSVSELAWIVENLLNQVLEDSLLLSHSLRDLCADVQQELVQIVENRGRVSADFNHGFWLARADKIQHEVEASHDADVMELTGNGLFEYESLVEAGSRDEQGQNDEIEKLIAASAKEQRLEKPADNEEPDDSVIAAPDKEIEALDLAAGETVDTVVIVEDENEIDIGTVTNDEEVDRTTELDDTVLQVFASEVQQHMAILQQVVDQKNDPNAGFVTDELIRATHTLRGCSRSIGFDAMSDVCEQLDALVNQKQQLRQELSKTDYSYLQSAHELIAETIRQALSGGSFPDVLLPNYRALEEDLRAHQADEMPAISVLPDDDQPDDRTDAKPEGKINYGDDAFVTTVDALSAPLGDDELAMDLVQIFREESRDILDRIDHSLHQCRSSGISEALLATMRRELHTLKGSARAAGVNSIGNLSHNTESVLVNSVDGYADDALMLDLLEEVHDTLVALTQTPSDQRLLEMASRLNDRVLHFEAPSVAGQYDADTNVSLSGTTDPASITAAQSLIEETVPSMDAMDSAGHVRVSASVLENLANYAGEVGIARARLEQKIGGARVSLDDLHGNIQRFREQLRELDIQAESRIQALPALSRESGHGDDFDPLEFDRFSRLQSITRSLSESLDELTTIQAGLIEFANESESVLQEQSHLNDELQEGLLRTRMVAFSTYIPRLRHITRQTAREIGKQARLSVHGAEVEIDRNILDQLSGPFEHIIRNALDHGIESGAERLADNKTEIGEIAIRCHQEGGEVVIEFSDDGRGLDFDRIRAQAAVNDPNHLMSDDDLIQLLVMSGFSTADKLTQVSGRGIGLDVVQNAVKKLGGALTVHSERGVGTTFTLRLPVTLAVTQALLVYAGEQRYAIPLRVISRILKIDRKDAGLPGNQGDRLFEFQDKRYPVMYLSERLGLQAPSTPANKVSVLMIRMGAREVALVVDRLVGTQDIVVKPLGGQATGIDGISGGSLLPDGSVVLILDIAGLWHHEQLGIKPVDSDKSAELLPSLSEKKPIVLVVDDSLTVRKVTARSLQKNGYDARMATDGIDALEKVRVDLPALMLVDIEMPRMDGFELVKRIRMDDRSRDVPIIVITSRSGSRHREKATELGADAYLTKPYQVDELLHQVDNLIRNRSQ